MADRPKFFDDLAGVAGGAMSAFAGLREELSALVRARVDEAVRRLDLVKREEFDAMAELARRAKAEVETLEARVALLESREPITNALPEKKDLLPSDGGTTPPDVE
jgi:BMFP domain-containing protein YqiC